MTITEIAVDAMDALAPHGSAVIPNLARYVPGLSYVCVSVKVRSLGCASGGSQGP